MNYTKNSRTSIVIGIICVLATAVFVYTIIHAVYYYEPESGMSVLPIASTTLQVSHASSTLGIPVQIIIPTIHIDTKIQSVGITSKGNMGVPNNFTDTGWYKYGSLPGTIGSSVIDGHVDNGLGISAVFKHLKELHIGDDVYVVMSTKKKLHFQVIDKQIYYYINAPLTKIFNQTDIARLNLITCDGNWVSSTKTDDHRVVVFTKLIQ